MAGVEGGPAPKERCLPPPGRLKKDGDGWAGCACVCVKQTRKVSEDFGKEGGLALKDEKIARSAPRRRSGWRGGRAGSNGAVPPPSGAFASISFPSPTPHLHSHILLALREGGVAGVEEGLAPQERRLPPPERPGDGEGRFFV